MSTLPHTSATGLARQNGLRLANETRKYRCARNELLAAEVELRRHIERVAAQRRALPPGGTVPKHYAFVGENGPGSFSALFGDKHTLAVYSYSYRYSYRYGPKRVLPCPQCTSLMGRSVADPGQDPRGAPDLLPLWTILDSTPEGRGAG